MRAGEGLWWKVLLLVNAGVFTVYLRRRHYTRLWLGALGALLLGPLIWLSWPIVVWWERREVERARRHEL